MNKLTQRLSDLTRQLAVARRNRDQEAIESLEDQIFSLGIELEEEYNDRYSQPNEYS